MANSVKIHRLYKHFKGNVYYVTDVVKHTETEKMMVVYIDISDTSKRWVRPLDNFLECVIRSGVKYERFTLLEEDYDPDKT